MGNDSVIYIRTDGNSNIATGHLVRCLCIAQALEESGRKVCFLVSDITSSSLLKDLCNSIFHGVSFSFETKILESARFDHLDLETEELCSFLTNSNYDCLNNNVLSVNDTTSSVAMPKPFILVDSYYVTESYFHALRQVAAVAYIDDLRAFDYDVDIVINYDVIPHSREEEYKQAYTKARKTLLGAQYTPLRKQFQNQEVTLREKIQDVLITTGGSDPYNFTSDLVSNLLSLDNKLDIHVVIGKLFSNTATLEALANEYPLIHLHKNVSDMASLMKQCDFAISAAGTTLYELCALGIPAISISMADNQTIIAETFAETGAVPYAGDIRNVSICDAILHHLTNVSNNISIAHEQQRKMRELVDGNGVINITKALCI